MFRIRTCIRLLPLFISSFALNLHGGDRAPEETENPAIDDTCAPYAFCLPVEDVYSLRGRGVIVVGEIRKGSVYQGDTLFLRSGNKERIVTVERIESEQQPRKHASAGDTVSLLLSGISTGQANEGDLLVRHQPSTQPQQKTAFADETERVPPDVASRPGKSATSETPAQGPKARPIIAQGNALGQPVRQQTEG